MGEPKRISFDRPQIVEISDTTLEIIRDSERLEDGWERVYINYSIIDLDSAPDKYRFGTGDAKTPKWHTEEPTPVADVVYCTCGEFHCRRHDRGIFGVYAGTLGDIVKVFWHGYDKLVGER